MTKQDVVSQEHNPEAKTETPKVEFTVKGMTGDAKSDGKVFEGLYERAMTGCKAAIQASKESEERIMEATMAAAYIAQKHGNVMPAHRLVMSLAELPDREYKSRALEIKIWFQRYTAVRWETEAGKVFGKDSKPYQDEKKVYKLEEGANTPYYATDVAQRGREAAQTTRARTLNPITFDQFKNRVFGLRKWYERSLEERHEAGKEEVKKGDKARIQKGLKALESAMIDTFGEEIVEESNEGRKAA